MRNSIFTFISAVSFSLLLSGCIKNTACQPKTVVSEDAAMLSFAVANGITATRHSTGMYYQVVNPGSGVSPNINSTLSVRYTGTLMDGTVFDSQTVNPVGFQLNQVITGWQVGLPLIQKGGVIRLIIPSSMGYGCQANGPIPANSILYFEVELVDVI